MSSTNKTAHYELPQFVENDIFNPLVDDNDAYEKIDTALYNVANAEADDAADIVSIKSRLDTAEGKVEALETQNGTDVLTTVAQTLSGAVNELKSGEDALDDRLDVVEDAINNATTGLSVKVAALETQNGSEVLDTVAQTLSGGINELNQVVMFVTPEQFGAIGDGVTDDTAALTEAFTHPYVRMSNKVYRITNTIEVHSNIVEGNDAKIVADFSEWKYKVLDFVGVDIISVNKLEIDANNIGSIAFFVESNGNDNASAESIKIKDCYAHDMNNGTSQLSASGIFVTKQSDYVLIDRCKVKNVHRNSHNASISSTGIAVTNLKEQAVISNNIIDGVYHDGVNEVNADGIIVYGMDDDNNAIVKGNHIYNCQGRGIKIQTNNSYIINNVIINNDIDLIESFRYIDIQYGNSVIENNILNAINTTGGGDISYIKADASNTDYATEYKINNNICKSDGQRVHAGVQITGNTLLDISACITNNSLNNVDNVILVNGSNEITSKIYIFATNNFFSSGNTTLAKAISIASAVDGHVVVADNLNMGNALTSLFHKDISVPNTVATYQDLLDAIAAQITQLGITTGKVAWIGNDSFLYETIVISATSNKTYLFYNNNIFIRLELNNTASYYRINGTALT